MEEKKNENEIEEWKDVKKGQKSSTVVIIILLILLVAAVAVGFLYGDKLYALVHKTEESNEKVEKTTTSQEETTKEQQQEEVTEEIKPLDLSKCLNCDWIISNPKEEKSSTNFTINNDNNKVTISINWETFGQESGLSAYPKDVKYYDVKGINGNVIDVIEGGSGQSISSTTFYYLLEDGTVEYTKLFNKNTDSQGHTFYTLNMSEDNFTSQGKVPNVSKIVKLYNVSARGEYTTGHSTTIGALADGSFYDLKVD